MRLRRKNKNDIDDKMARLWEKASQLDKQGQYKEAIDSYDKLSTIIRQNLGERNVDYGRLLNNMGLVYFHMGDYDQAERSYRRGYEVHGYVLIEYFKENHPDAAGLYTNDKMSGLAEIQSGMADINSNLALLYQQMGDDNKAEALFHEALRTRLGLYLSTGKYSTDYVNSLNNLALIYQLRGDYNKADVLYEEASKVLSEAEEEES